MKTRIIGVAGPSGAGKTTIANKIANHYGAENCIIISSDNYYKDLSHLSREARATTNFDHPDSIDFNLLALHLNFLKSGKSVDIPTYNFTTHTREQQTIRIDPKSIIIVEGILVLHPQNLIKSFDVKVYVKTDLDLCLMRRLHRDTTERGRDVLGVIDQYKRTVRPMYKEFIEKSSKNAHVVVENNLDNLNFDIDEVISCLNQLLGGETFSIRRKYSLFATNADQASILPMRNTTSETTRDETSSEKTQYEISPIRQIFLGPGS